MVLVASILWGLHILMSSESNKYPIILPPWSESCLGLETVAGRSTFGASGASES